MRDTCDGLVIRECAYGENDRLVTLLTADEGKVLMTAKGARSIKSKTQSLCSLFTYANYEFYERNGRRWMSGGSVNNGFYGLSSDMEGFALACYIVQLANEITGEGVPAHSVLQMTLNTLYAIEKKLKPYAQIKSAYEIFAACESGFSPDMSACADCEKPFDKDGWLDIMNGRLICSDCLSRRGSGEQIPPTDRFMTQNILLPINSSAVAAWRYVASASPKKVLAFSLADEESRNYLYRATEAYIINHLERNFEALEFYNTVKE